TSSRRASSSTRPSAVSARQVPSRYGSPFVARGSTSGVTSSPGSDPCGLPLASLSAAEVREIEPLSAREERRIVCWVHTTAACTSVGHCCRETGACMRMTLLFKRASGRVVYKSSGGPPGQAGCPRRGDYTTNPQGGNDEA